ncbi:MAG: 16S rRNA (guanine(966)-N(2))-methyltransferase RsmD [Sedimenticolaceae bacterium]
MGRRQKKTTEPTRHRGQANQVRIIAGEHRGRRLEFPDLPGLRPTSDRVKETVFNWLQPLFPGAACLDLFAGSGALGLEAASRGAGRVTLLDMSAVAVQQLRSHQALLGLKQVRIEQADARKWLETTAEPFEVVFLDPPFADDLLTICCRRLEDNGWLEPNARIYLERNLHGPEPSLPASWVQLKAKKAGEVAYALYTR